MTERFCQPRRWSGLMVTSRPPTFGPEVAHSADTTSLRHAAPPIGDSDCFRRTASLSAASSSRLRNRRLTPDPWTYTAAGARECVRASGQTRPQPCLTLRGPSPAYRDQGERCADQTENGSARADGEKWRRRGIQGPLKARGPQYVIAQFNLPHTSFIGRANASRHSTFRTSCRVRPCSSTADKRRQCSYRYWIRNREFLRKVKRTWSELL
jgi:hypothetical protein